MAKAKRRADYWKTYVRPNPEQQRQQKRAWSRALAKLRHQHLEEFEVLYRAELVVEARRAALSELDERG